MKMKSLKTVAMFFLVCILISITTLTGCKNQQADLPENSIDNKNQYPFLTCFRERDVDAVKDILKDNDIEMVYAEEESVFGVDRYKFDDLSLSAFFSYNESIITGVYFSIDTNIVVNQSESIDEETINNTKSVLSKIITICNELFGVEVNESYNYYAIDGSIVSPDSIDFEGWLKSDYKFALFVRDEDSSFWKIYGEMMPYEEGMSEVPEDNNTESSGEFNLVFSFDCITDPELFKDVTADITLK